MKERVVVFCSDGYCSIGLIRALGEAGYMPECYCYGTDGRYVLASRYVSKGIVFSTEIDAINYLLNDYPVYECKPVLFTFPDKPAYLVDVHQDALKKKFILMSAGEQGNLAYWMNKKTQMELAQKHGFAIPWMIEMSKDDNIPEAMEYPVFTKSIRTVDGGKCDESVCLNKEELKAKIFTIASERYLVMQYIKKRQEINYFGISIKGKVYIDFHDERNRFSDKGYGHYCIFMRCEHDDVYDRCVSMILETGYEGLFDLEFILGEDGILYFMEINFRVDGEIYKLSKGINLLDEWCKLVRRNKEELPQSLLIKRDYFTGMTEVNDFRQSVLTGKMNPIKWFWEFCKTDTHMLVNLKDPIPALVKLWYVIKRNIKKNKDLKQ